MRYAVVITGILRCVDESLEWFNTLPANCDLFIVTDKKSELLISRFNKVADYIIVENSFYHHSLQKYLISIKEGTKILQWQKLTIASAMLKEYALNNGVEYDAIYKVRTDVLGLETIKFQKISDDDFYMCSDLAFASSSSKFSDVSDFFAYGLTKYNKNNEYHSFNLDTLKNSDVKAGRFQWLSYPKRLINESEFDIEAIKRSIISLQDAHQIDEFEPIVNFRKNYQRIKFPSEPLFLTYVLNQFKTINLLSNKVRLMPERNFNESEKLIFKYIKQKNINELMMIKSCKGIPDGSGFLANKLRDLSIELEIENIKAAYHIMNLAKDIRPTGEFILKKHLEYGFKVKEQFS